MTDQMDYESLPDSWRPDADSLTRSNVELSELDRFQDLTGYRFANNSPKYSYKCVNCGHHDWSHLNEYTLWPCSMCRLNDTLEDHLHPMRKTITECPGIPKMWHGHHSLTTGNWTTDRRQLSRDLRDGGDKQTQRLGMDHNYIEVDPSDKAAIGITDEGMDATHDHHVKIGAKESKGNYVFPMGPKATP